MKANNTLRDFRVECLGGGGGRGFSLGEDRVWVYAYVFDSVSPSYRLPLGCMWSFVYSEVRRVFSNLHACPCPCPCSCACVHFIPSRTRCCIGVTVFRLRREEGEMETKGSVCILRCVALRCFASFFFLVCRSGVQ